MDTAESDCSHRSPSHLETLPRELMWVLLDYVPETAHGVKLNIRAVSIEEEKIFVDLSRLPLLCAKMV